MTTEKKPPLRTLFCIGINLLSDLSGFVSGQTLVVDGGHIMY